MKSLIRYCLSAAATLIVLNLQQAQASCNDGIGAVAPDARYFIEVDGTVTDSTTGLMWQRCALGQSWDGSTCSGSAGEYTWTEALIAAEADSSHTFSDWRLPNIKELSSLVETSCTNPSINENLFPNTNSWLYWSSSDYAVLASHAWSVSFHFGRESNEHKSLFSVVRLVRAGQ